MKVKLISPFYTNFNILRFNVMRNDQRYLSFWQKVKEAYRSDQTIHIAGTEEKDLIYEQIEEDGDHFTPEQFTLMNDPFMGELMEQAADYFTEQSFRVTYDVTLADTVCRIYDNAIGILETTIDIEEELDQIKDEATWKRLFFEIQDFSNHYMKFLIERYYDKSIKPYIDGIKQVDSFGYLQRGRVTEQLLNKGDRKIEKMNAGFFTAEKEGAPLWVNRTLFISSLDNLPLFFNSWLSLDGENIEDVKKKLNDDCFYFGWGNNLVVNQYDTKAFSHAIDALNLCQYYNVIMDHINGRFSVLVGEVYSIKRRWKMIRKIEKLLELNNENADLLFMQLNEQSLNLQGHRKKYFAELLGKWNIDAIRTSISKKIEFSQSRLDYFYRKSSKLSHTVSESFLFGIGGIALVDFFANVSQFSRNLKANPEMEASGDDSVGFITLGRILSPDNMIWSGVLLLLFLFIFFAYVKKRS